MNGDDDLIVGPDSSWLGALSDLPGIEPAPPTKDNQKD